VSGREAIMRVHTAGKPIGEDVDLQLLARQTSGLTGADLANLCNEAAIAAVRAHRKALEQADFDSALERVVAGMQSRRTLNDHERRVVAFHEAGHALCAELLPSIDRVHKISIVPRGRALGYTLNLPDEDRYLKTREELVDHIVVLLAGRVAESVVFGAITTGASDDLKRVNEISRAMVTDYGMGAALGSRRLPAEDYSMSDATRLKVDDAQQEITDDAYRRALALVVDNRALLERFGTVLLENEVLERGDIERIVTEHLAVPTFEQALDEAGMTAGNGSTPKPLGDPADG